MVLFHRTSLRNNYVASKVFLYDLATLSLYKHCTRYLSVDDLEG
jgi:hypothetical protein